MTYEQNKLEDLRVRCRALSKLLDNIRTERHRNCTALNKCMDSMSKPYIDSDEKAVLQEEREAREALIRALDKRITIIEQNLNTSESALYHYRRYE